MKTLVSAFAVLLVSASAFATSQITIPAGTKVEKYKYNFTPNSDPTRLAACGVYANLSSDRVLSNMSYQYDSGPFYQYLKTEAPIELTVEAKQFSVEQGNDCEYKGFASEDPDWNCTTSVTGYWMRGVFTLKDKFGNTWTTFDKTDLLSDKSQLPSEEQFGQEILNDAQSRMTSYCRF